jgi:hypothetical protein
LYGVKVFLSMEELLSKSSAIIKKSSAMDKKS